MGSAIAVSMIQDERVANDPKTTLVSCGIKLGFCGYGTNSP